jgi:hypothetical protein
MFSFSQIRYIFNLDKINNTLESFFYNGTVVHVAVYQAIFKGKQFISFNPLTPKAKKCSGWAENVTTDSSRYYKNFSFYPFIFYLALLKSYRIKCVFYFQNF